MFHVHAFLHCTYSFNRCSSSRFPLFALVLNTFLSATQLRLLSHLLKFFKWIVFHFGPYPLERCFGKPIVPTYWMLCPSSFLIQLTKAQIVLGRRDTSYSSQTISEIPPYGWPFSRSWRIYRASFPSIEDRPWDSIISVSCRIRSRRPCEYRNNGSPAARFRSFFRRISTPVSQGKEYILREASNSMMKLAFSFVPIPAFHTLVDAHPSPSVSRCKRGIRIFSGFGESNLECV